MSASAATRLRQLATQYHSGEINLQSYRQQRAELLDRLTSSDADPEESSTTLPQRTRPAATPAPPPAPATAAAPPLAPPPAPAAQAPRPKPPAAEPPQSKPRSGMGTYAVVALIALLGFGAVWFFYMRQAPATYEGQAMQPGADTESYSAIRDFLDADDWSDEQIANFNTRWATLPDDMRAAALDQPWYQNFVERVRSRVKEQRALTATADSAGTVEGPLAALASSVGIDISSPDRPVAPRVVEVAGEESAGPKEKVAHTATKAPAPAATPAAAAPVAKAATASTPTHQARPGASAAQAGSAQVTRTAAQPPAPPVGPDPCRAMVGARKPQCRDALSTGGHGPTLAVVSRGEFQMGNKDVSQEQPVHTVKFDKSFAIAEFETSQAEYRLFCTETKRDCEAQPWTGDDLPVVRVSWQDARDYVTWLSKVSGRNYRLATEAEWEFAVRGGTQALYPSGNALLPIEAVFSTGVTKPTAPAGRNRQMYANTTRDSGPKLYHAIGNVREWVEDAWSPNYSGAPEDGSARKSGSGAQKVVRGGAYTDIAAKLRFTTREGLDAATRDNVTGFRVVREL